MEVELDGHKVTVPHCTCGKCVVRRLRKDHFTSIPYNKNMGSIYAKDFDWKTNNNNDPEFYNRSKHTGFEGMYRDHLPTSLMSTMKFDYKPFKVKLEEKKPQKVQVPNVPFLGRTSYETQFPNWGAANVRADSRGSLPDIKVPFRGCSNYKENYLMYDPKFYNMRDPIDPKATLNFNGKLNPDTSYNTSYLPIDFNQPHYFSKGKIRKTDVEKSSFLPAEFPPSNFQSNYATSFVDYKDHRCKLAEYLKTRGIKYLEI